MRPMSKVLGLICLAGINHKMVLGHIRTIRILIAMRKRDDFKTKKKYLNKNQAKIYLIVIEQEIFLIRCSGCKWICFLNMIVKKMQFSFEQPKFSLISQMS